VALHDLDGSLEGRPNQGVGDVVGSAEGEVLSLAMGFEQQLLLSPVVYMGVAR